MAKALFQTIFTFAIDIPEGVDVDDWVAVKENDTHPFEIVSEAMEGNSAFSIDMSIEVVDDEAAPAIP